MRRLAARISHRFGGQRCARSVARDPRIVHLDLAGRTLVDVDAVGKWLLLRFDDERTVFGHLRMDGRWDVGPRSNAPERQRRLEAQMEDGWLTAVDMPVLGVVETAREHTIVGHLGPDLCGPTEPDVEAITARLVANGDRPLAGAMLDQRVVAGWGNIYAVETPFIAGVSPNQPINAIDGLDELVRVGVALIRTNAERGPQNTTGRRLDTAHHWVYGRSGRACGWCSTPIRGAGEHEVSWGRLAYWCPSCQRVDDVRVVDGDRVERALALHPARRRL